MPVHKIHIVQVEAYARHPGPPRARRELAGLRNFDCRKDNTMSVRVTGKHMVIGDSFRTRITGQIHEAIGKYFDGGFSSQVLVEKAGSRSSADCKIHLDSGANLHAEGKANDPQIAFESAFD